MPNKGGTDSCGNGPKTGRYHNPTLARGPPIKTNGDIKASGGMVLVYYTVY
jgi:hypothetical protein